MKNLPYLIIIILIGVILLQRACSPKPKIVEKRDTITIYIQVRDTILVEKEKIKLVYSKKDTIWLKDSTYVPKNTYQGLYKQYVNLGSNYFKTNTFTTVFPIKGYGTVSVTDTIKANQLIGTSLITNLSIPETTVTVEKIVPYRQFYIGGSIEGSKSSPIKGIYGGLIYKDKKDHLYGTSLGYNGEIVIKADMYWPIKFK